MLLLPTPVKILIKCVLTLVIWTAVGQIRVSNQSLENRYHNFVNSDGFQTWFWALALPVTWTGEKIQAAIKGNKKVQEAAR